jgi:hypothetical protein
MAHRELANENRMLAACHLKAFERLAVHRRGYGHPRSSADWLAGIDTESCAANRTIESRHARTWSAHPRLASHAEDVDGRHGGRP